MYSVMKINGRYIVVRQNLIFGGYAIVQKFYNKVDADNACDKLNRGRRK